MPWSSDSCNDRRCSYFTGNTCNIYADNFKVFFGTWSQACSAIVMTIWRPDLKFMKNAYISTFLELWVAILLSGRIRSPWFLNHFWSAFNALSDSVSWFLTELLQFYLFWTWFHIVLTFLASDLMAYISKATHELHWFSYWRHSIATFKYKNNFLTRPGGATNLQKNLFGTQTIHRVSIKFYKVLNWNNSHRNIFRIENQFAFFKVETCSY